MGPVPMTTEAAALDQATAASGRVLHWMRKVLPAARLPIRPSSPGVVQFKRKVTEEPDW